MKKLSLIALGMIALSTPAFSQIDPSGTKPDLKPYFDKVNNCLAAFDQKAKLKKISGDLYKTALEGACTDELDSLRALHSLGLEHDDNQKFLVDQLNDTIRDGKAAMVTRYVMR